MTHRFMIVSDIHMLGDDPCDCHQFHAYVLFSFNFVDYYA